MKLFDCNDILSADGLWELQGSFCTSMIPFKYQLTEGEYNWAKFVEGKYCISDWVLSNTDENNVLTFDCPAAMSEALQADGCSHKAVMLDDSTALQKLFFWLALDED